jgi:multisubunit Na+/H+ antiporter MnhG subunit
MGGTPVRDVPPVVHEQVKSFGVLLALQAFDLTALGFDLTLLLLHLGLRLVVLNPLVLHLVADGIAANRADAATDRGTRPWMTDRGTD